MKKLSEDSRNRIIHALRSGKSDRQIAKEMGFGKTTIGCIRKKFCDDIVIPPKQGRPYKLSARDEAWAVRQITSGKADTATKVAKMMEEEGKATVHAKTIRRSLRRAGMKAVVKQKKPKLLDRHTKARYEFATKYKDWTVDDWKRVVFSDETKINRFGSDAYN